jgi:peptidyl-prolyl cis-trans isomerase A (cyclophilin A)
VPKALARARAHARSFRPRCAQVGICGDPALYAQWSSKRIEDDKTTGSNARGTVTFATSGPDARTCQVFFNLVDNAFLDDQGFAPFAVVIGDGMSSAVDKIYGGYGEGAPKGRGPEQARIKAEGDAYLVNFPKLSYIASAKVVA